MDTDVDGVGIGGRDSTASLPMLDVLHGPAMIAQDWPALVERYRPLGTGVFQAPKNAGMPMPTY